MKLIFTANEINTVEETLKNIGLGYIDLYKFIDERYKDITLEDLGLPKFNEYEDGIGYFKTHHYIADGSDVEEYHLYISEEFIVDLLELYGDTIKVSFHMVKDMWLTFRTFIEPMIKKFVGKWTNVMVEHTKKCLDESFEHTIEILERRIILDKDRIILDKDEAACDDEVDEIFF